MELYQESTYLHNQTPKKCHLLQVPSIQQMSDFAPWRQQQHEVISERLEALDTVHPYSLHSFSRLVGHAFLLPFLLLFPLLLISMFFFVFF